MALVLGLDPDIHKIPAIYKTSPQHVDLLSWGEDIIVSCRDSIQGVKFQMAYFEAYGLLGYQALIELIQLCRRTDLKVIMDAKRGDIGATSAAYATAYLNQQNYIGDNPFFSDYLTVNPLMGEDCMMPFVDAAIQNNCGLFILLETSNPGASMILKAKDSNGQQLNVRIAEFIQKIHDKMELKDNELGPIGCVVGATNSDVAHWRKKLPNSLFLMPGIGAQGGDIETVKSLQTPSGEGVWVPISRGITAVDINISSKELFKESIKNNCLKYKSLF